MTATTQLIQAEPIESQFNAQAETAPVKPSPYPPEPTAERLHQLQLKSIEALSEISQAYILQR